MSALCIRAPLCEAEIEFENEARITMFKYFLLAACE